jgi:hypothetical protein
MLRQWDIGAAAIDPSFAGAVQCFFDKPPRRVGNASTREDALGFGSRKMPDFRAGRGIQNDP